MAFLNKTNENNRKTKIQWNIRRPTKSFRGNGTDCKKGEKRIYETTNRKHFYRKIIYQGMKHQTSIINFLFGVSCYKNLLKKFSP